MNMVINLFLILFIVILSILIIWILLKRHLILLGGLIAAVSLLISTILYLIYGRFTPTLELVLLFGMILSGLVNVFLFRKQRYGTKKL